MTCDEIRFWLTELRRRGWPMAALGRALGANVRSIWRKARGREWIYPTEQIRWSHVLNRIISGELVWMQDRGGHHKKNVVIAEHRQPLRSPTRIVFDFSSGRCRVTTTAEPPHNRLPNFQQLLNDPPQGRYPSFHPRRTRRS